MTGAHIIFETQRVYPYECWVAADGDAHSMRRMFSQFGASLPTTKRMTAEEGYRAFKAWAGERVTDECPEDSWIYGQYFVTVYPDKYVSVELRRDLALVVNDLGGANVATYMTEAYEGSIEPKSDDARRIRAGALDSEEGDPDELFVARIVRGSPQFNSDMPCGPVNSDECAFFRTVLYLNTPGDPLCGPSTKKLQSRPTWSKEALIEAIPEGVEWFLDVDLGDDEEGKWAYLVIEDDDWRVCLWCHA